MWKTIQSSINGIKFVVKYAGLLLVIVGILGYAAEQLETWFNANAPKEEKPPVK